VLQNRSLHSKLDPTLRLQSFGTPDVRAPHRGESDGDQVGSCAMSSGERTMQKARCDFRPGYLHTFVRLRFMSRVM
jgi:hypothetical protein